MSKCELYDRECIDCGECDICDLDPNKLCDNCSKCVEINADYAEIEITQVYTSESDYNSQNEH